MFVGSTEKLRQADFPDVQLHLMSLLADWPSWLKLTPEVYHIAHIECKHHSLDPPPPGLPLHTAYTRKSWLGIRSRPAVERRVVLEGKFQKVFESGLGRIVSKPYKGLCSMYKGLENGLDRA